MPLSNNCDSDIIVNVNNYISNSFPSPASDVDVGMGADLNAAYVLTGSATGSLPFGQPHETLRQLIHLADDDGPRGSQWVNNLFKTTDPAPFPSGSVWYLDATMTHRVVDSTVTRNSSQMPVTIQWRAYAPDGVTVVESYTDSIVYVSTVFEASRTRSQP